MKAGDRVWVWPQAPRRPGRPSKGTIERPRKDHGEVFEVVLDGEVVPDLIHVSGLEPLSVVDLIAEVEA